MAAHDTDAVAAGFFYPHYYKFRIVKIKILIMLCKNVVAYLPFSIAFISAQPLSHTTMRRSAFERSMS